MIMKTLEEKRQIIFDNLAQDYKDTIAYIEKECNCSYFQQSNCYFTRVNFYFTNCDFADKADRYITGDNLRKYFHKHFKDLPTNNITDYLEWIYVDDINYYAYSLNDLMLIIAKNLYNALQEEYDYFSDDDNLREYLRME